MNIIDPKDVTLDLTSKLSQEMMEKANYKDKSDKYRAELIDL